MKLQLITFNVNGLRSIKDYYAQSRLNNNLNFPEFLNSFNSDIICFQEHKTNLAIKLSHDLSFPKGYAAFYAFPRISKKIGYSGVVTFVKEDSPWMPIAWYDGFSGLNDKRRVPLHDSPLLISKFTSSELSELDSEGRCIITDHFHFILLNIYFPNDSGPERSEFREKFYEAVRLRCLDLIKEHKKSLIILGDINIAYHPFDHCEFAQAFKSSNYTNVKEYLNDDSTNNFLLKEFYSNPMRKWLADWLYKSPPSADHPEGWRDCFRSVHSFEEEEQEKYTCWNTQMSTRGTNFGTRIDTIFTSGSLFLQSDVILEDCDIMPKVMGSDHCPVMARFSFPASFEEINQTVLIECKLTKGNIPATFGKLDSFFTAKKRSEETIEIVETEKKIENKKVSKTKISDYFNVSKETVIINSIDSSVTKSEKTELTTEPEPDMTTSPTVNHANNPVNTQHPLSSLFNRPVSVPLCSYHREPCKLSKVKKLGTNQGRSFYSCARPGGAKDDPEARCDHFEWVNKGSK